MVNDVTVTIYTSSRSYTVFARNVTIRIVKYIESLTELKPVKPFKIYSSLYISDWSYFL